MLTFLNAFALQATAMTIDIKFIFWYQQLFYKWKEKLMNKAKWPARAVLPVAQPGLIFILLSFLMTGGFFYLGWGILSWISLALSAFICWFFRDPDRQIPKDEKSLVSPADGKIIVVEKRPEGCAYLSVPCIKISIFMNVFNVHVLP